ncbi:MAG: YtcA family lipoprotein [Roseinatronobacter sp.]
MLALSHSKRVPRPARNSSVPIGATVSALVLLAGCAPSAHAPSVPLFGSFLPIWLIAAALGIIVTVLMRAVFIRTGIHDRLPMPLLVYLFSVVKFSVGIWALWVGELAILGG